MSESHQREEAIFDAAMELPTEQRAAHLEHACGGDAALRQRIESLLKACESKCEFLDSPPDPAAAKTMNVLPASFEKAGDKIGRYKLLRQIGEGGCGVVYMAEQLEPVQRRVALKVIKLGLDTKSVIARFEAERQALALMDHPNIAKVLDAGATETGRPYFVMELVRGLKITEYCDEARLSTHARLDLFIQVCQAIQHAHQKGIIHRDIKPLNILVTINDGVPVPKVIDFGVAKATGGLKLTNKTVFTAFEQFIGTPAFMSPEPAVLTSLDIDTRSDIYALGVLLYELLTGKTPFDAQELLAIGLDEMRRTIREQEPPRPSTCISTLAQNELSTTAQRRGIEAPKLVSELRGDLDWIVMKALEKDRARRYETANGLAMDIERHLKNEPVVACPSSRLYRLQKTMRRNKLAVAAGSAVAASLVIGMTLSTILFFRERAARKQANEHASRANEQTAIAQAVNDFLQEDLLRQASSYSQAGAGFTPDPNLTVREALKRAAERIGDRFKDFPLQEAAVRNQIGLALLDVGEPERAILHLQRSLELYRSKPGSNHRNTLIAMGNLGLAYRSAGERHRALPLLEETLKLMKARLGPDDPMTVNTMQNLAVAYGVAGKIDQALPLFEKILKLERARLGPSRVELLRAMGNLANGYRAARKFDQALPLYEEALKLATAKLGPNHPDTQTAMNNLAIAYSETDKTDQALPLFEETLKLRKAGLGPNHPDTVSAAANLGEAYRRAGKLDQLEAMYREQLAQQSGDLLAARIGLARLLLESAKTNNASSGRSQELAREGEQLLREGLAIREKAQPDEWGTFNLRSMLGGALLGQRKLAEAQPLVVAGYDGLKRLSETKTALDNNAKDDLAEAMDRLVMLYSDRPDLPEAARWQVEIERVRRVSDPGAIRRWLILAPIAQTAGQSSASDLELEQLSNEANLRPRAGDKVSVGGRELVWRECPLRDYAIDFNELLGVETTESVAYAVCYVQMTAPRRGLVLKVGSDDQARVYLNGQKIYEQGRARAQAGRGHDFGRGVARRPQRSGVQSRERGWKLARLFVLRGQGGPAGPGNQNHSGARISHSPNVAQHCRHST